MRTIRLEIENIQSMKALHIYLRYRLDLPAHYGCNLDALHDALGEIGEDTQIVLRGPACPGSEVEKRLEGLLAVLRDSAEGNKRLCWRWED